MCQLSEVMYSLCWFVCSLTVCSPRADSHKRLIFRVICPPVQHRKCFEIISPHTQDVEKNIKPMLYRGGR